MIKIQATNREEILILPPDVEPLPVFPYAILSINNIQIKSSKMATTLKDTQAPFTITWGAPVDAKNNPAPVDGGYNLASTDETIATVEHDPENTLKVKATLTGKLGIFQVKISADADLGEGVVTIEGSELFEVVADQAIGFGAAAVNLNP